MSCMDITELSQVVTRLQLETEELRKKLDEAVAMRRQVEKRLATTEGECRSLSDDAEKLKYKLACCQDENMVLSAQVDMVNLIFGGNRRGRDCCGCN